MLAKPKITTGKSAKNYFEKDTYYINNEYEQGSFYGKLKDDLGLEEFNLKDFDSILKAQNPLTGEQLLKLNKKDLDENGERKRAALDLTFAADKSISILYEVASEEEKTKIRNAFNKSIDVALDYIEENYSNSKSRDKIAGDNSAQNKLLFTRFDHSENRNDDMHLHQHCLMTNLIQDENGNYKSMEFNQTMLNHQLIGQIQRNEFARNLQEIGIETEILDVKVGSFKAKGVSQELREEFSTRSKDIKEEMERTGETSYEATHAAQKKTAKWKDKNKDRLQIQKDNIERLEKAGADIEQLQKTKDDLKIRTMTAETAVDIAIEDLTDKNSVFKKEEIYKHALKVALTTDLTIADIVKEVAKKEEIITISKDKNQFTTIEVLEKEEYIFSLKDEKNFSITADKEVVEKAIKSFQIDKGFELKKGQVELAHTILQNDSQFIIAQGVSGAGKSTSLEIVKSVADLENRKIVALAPTGTATTNLAKEARIKESYTVAKFLQMQGNDIKDALIIVDEAGMLGLRDTHSLLRVAKENNLKVVFSGDKNQKKSISQGDIFPGMQRNGFTTVHLDEGNRQKTDLMREAVKNILEKDVTKALEILKDTTREIKDSDERLSAAQEEYLKDRHNSLLITSTNIDRKQLNKSIRDILVANGEITNSKIFDTRETPSLSDLEKRSSLHYKVEQKVFLSKNIGSISAGREAKITEINQDDNTITIEHLGKNQVFTEVVDLSTAGNSLNQFLETKKEFGIGDQIITKKNDKKVGMTNGQIGTITDIQKDKITVQFDKKEVTFDIRDYKYLDHAYVISDFASQGKTTNKVIAVANSQAASFNDFYTQITRAKFEAHIITDDMEELQKRAANESTKLNASELIAQYKQEQEEKQINKKEETKMTAREYQENLRDYTPERLEFDRNEVNEAIAKYLEDLQNNEEQEEVYKNAQKRLEMMQKRLDLINQEAEARREIQIEILEEQVANIEQSQESQGEEKKVEKSAVEKLVEKYENVNDLVEDIGNKKSFLEELKGIKIDDVKQTFENLNESFKNIDVKAARDIMIATIKSVHEVAKNEDITLASVAGSIVRHVQEQEKTQGKERGM